MARPYTAGRPSVLMQKWSGDAAGRAGPGYGDRPAGLSRREIGHVEQYTAPGTDHRRPASRCMPLRAPPPSVAPPPSTGLTSNSEIGAHALIYGGGAPHPMEAAGAPSVRRLPHLEDPHRPAASPGALPFDPDDPEVEAMAHGHGFTEHLSANAEVMYRKEDGPPVTGGTPSPPRMAPTGASHRPDGRKPRRSLHRFATQQSPMHAHADAHSSGAADSKLQDEDDDRQDDGAATRHRHASVTTHGRSVLKAALRASTPEASDGGGGGGGGGGGDDGSDVEAGELAARDPVPARVGQHRGVGDRDVAVAAADDDDAANADDDNDDDDDNNFGTEAGNLNYTRHRPSSAFRRTTSASSTPHVSPPSSTRDDTDDDVDTTEVLVRRGAGRGPSHPTSAEETDAVHPDETLVRRRDVPLEGSSDLSGTYSMRPSTSQSTWRHPLDGPRHGDPATMPAAGARSHGPDTTGRRPSTSASRASSGRPFTADTAHAPPRFSVTASSTSSSVQTYHSRFSGVGPSSGGLAAIAAARAQRERDTAVKKHQELMQYERTVATSEASAAQRRHAAALGSRPVTRGGTERGGLGSTRPMSSAASTQRPRTSGSRLSDATLRSGRTVSSVRSAVTGRPSTSSGYWQNGPAVGGGPRPPTSNPSLYRPSGRTRPRPRTGDSTALSETGRSLYSMTVRDRRPLERPPPTPQRGLGVMRSPPSRTSTGRLPALSHTSSPPQRRNTASRRASSTMRSPGRAGRGMLQSLGHSDSDEDEDDGKEDDGVGAGAGAGAGALKKNGHRSASSLPKMSYSLPAAARYPGVGGELAGTARKPPSSVVPSYEELVAASRGAQAPVTTFRK